MADGWRNTTLAEVSTIQIGRTPPRNNPSYWTTDLARPFCTIADLADPIVRPAREGVTEAAEVEGKAKRVPAGSLLLSFKLTIGRVGVAAVDVFPNEAIAWIEPTTPALDKRYLALWLESADLTTGAGRAVKGQTLNSGSLRAIPVAVPPLADQRRIVDLVAAIDAAATAANHEAAVGRAAYRTLARHLIEDPRWPRMPLREAVNVLMGRQRSPQHAFGDYMVPYLRAANVKDGSLELDDVLHMNFTPVEQQTFGLKAGDVLVTEGCGSLAQLGASARWSGEITAVVGFQNTLIRLRSKPSVTSAGFVQHLARHSQAAGWWARIASGTNIFHIGSRRAEVLMVPIPPVEAQGSVAEMLDLASGLAESASAYAGRLAWIRSTLVQDLLYGKHEIPNSYDRFLDGAA